MKNDYQEEPIGSSRRGVIEYLDEAIRKHVVRALFEIDVTDIRAALRRYRKENRKPLSLNSYLIYLYAQAIDATPGLQKYRLGARKMITFNEVDMAVLVEQKSEKGTYPATHIMRSANRKTLYEIEEEIQEARKIKDGDQGSGSWKNPRRLYEAMPSCFRRLVLAYIMRYQPHLRKKIFGSVGFSSVSMFGTSGIAWGVPITSHVINLVIGGIGQKLELAGGKPVYRDILGITLTMDHDFVDGAPAARFIRRFQKMAASLYGLS